MSQEKSLSHTRWECKYHVVWIPKYRKKKILRYGRWDWLRYCLKTYE